MAHSLARDIFAPNFIIEKDGDILPEAITKYITSVEYEDNAEMMDKITLSIGAQQVTDADQVYQLLDSKIFNEGNLIELRFGYGSQMSFIGAGEIVRLEPIFPQNGVPTLNVIAYDKSHRMSDKKSIEGESYKNDRDDTIARIIGVRHGMDVLERIQTTNGVHDRTQKVGVNDYEFLRKIADFNGFDFFTRYDKNKKKWVLFFEEPKDDQTQIYTFNYNLGEKAYENTLLEFNPNMNVKDQNIEYEILSFNRTEVKTIKSINKDSSKIFKFNQNVKEYEFKKSKDRKFAGPKKFEDNKKSDIEKPGMIKFKAFGKSREIVVSKLENEKDAKTEIEAWIKKRKENFITGSGKIVGVETLQSRHVVMLNGIGATLSGKYYITKVIHKMIFGAAPYICDFNCRRIVK